MRKKIDKIHEELFDDLDEMNKWIEDSDDDIIVVNVQIRDLYSDVTITTPSDKHICGGREKKYHLFYGIKDKEV